MQKNTSALDVAGDCTTHGKIHPCRCICAHLCIIHTPLPPQLMFLNQGSETPKGLNIVRRTSPKCSHFMVQCCLYFTSPRYPPGASKTELLPTAVTAKGTQFLQSDSQLNVTVHWSSAGAHTAAWMLCQMCERKQGKLQETRMFRGLNEKQGQIWHVKAGSCPDALGKSGEGVITWALLIA